MAFSLLALLDDVVSVLDDVAVLAKVATKKTGGVIGDDLALNAEQVQGVKPEEELEVIGKVMKGSFVNKAILVPIALLLTFFLPQILVPFLMIGGAFLCFEGVEKVIEKLFHKPAHPVLVLSKAEKIKGAIRTDFILSAEIIVISLGSMVHASFTAQVISLSLIAVLMTVFIYGVVALIIKLDDIGLYLIKKEKFVGLGHVLVKSMPWIMRGLGIVGTLAMFLVGGGIIIHGLESLGLNLHSLPLLVNNSITVALVVGGLLVGLVSGFQKLKGRKNENHNH